MPAEEGKKSTATALRRWSIYGLLMGDILALKIPRLSIPSMVPFIVAELGLPQSVSYTHLTLPTICSV